MSNCISHVTIPLLTSEQPANLEPMGAIGFEIWTMQNDILFDNIYIGHSIADAEKFAQETFFEK